MAYDTKELEQQAIEAITKYKLTQYKDIAPMIGISERTFFNHKMQELQSIKDAILRSKTEMRVALRQKMLKSTNGTLTVAMYKLVCTEEELKRLSMQYAESKNVHDVQLHTLSDEQVQEILEKRYAEES